MKVYDFAAYVVYASGSGCALTLKFDDTFPYTMDGCGPSGLARLRKALADDARNLP
jgi:hypothetical protein